MISFKTFTDSILKNKAAISSISNSKSFNFVIGNQAADLDSTVSAIALGYYLSLTPGNSQLENLKNTAIFPLINTPSATSKYRLDVKFVLENFLSKNSNSNLDTSEKFGIYIDETHPDLEHLLSNPDNSNSSVYLVDHNSLNIKQTFMDKFVNGIVDHHFDEKLHLNAKIRNIHPVCSCTSLVVLMIKNRLEELQISDYRESMPPNLIMSLLSSLSIDTSNFNDSVVEKIKDADIEATEWLLNLLDKYGTSVDSELEKVSTAAAIIPESKKVRNKSSNPLFANFSNKLFKYFTLLHSLKSDISQLDLTDLFEKDYKLVSAENESFGIINYGTSSIPARLAYLVKK
ncbi:Exopolyphosphatase, partial [Smittium culicis]